MTYLFEGTLTTKDHKGHVPHAFQVPAGTTRLIGRFSASPERAAGALFDNLISLSVFGPNGARGARHNNPEMDFAISAASATPGYVAGAIEPGEWTVFLDTFRILGPDPVQYRLEIMCDTSPVEAVPARTAPAFQPRGAGWYRGDLHAHTLHSDGSWDIPDLVDWAHRRKLDFLTLTDHNTVSGHSEIRAMATDALLTLGGLELTTHHGHALSLGGSEWREWRTGAVTGKTMPQLAEAVMQAGSTYIIAHPKSPGDPACTGCRWEFEDMMPGPARIVEIWNGGPWSEYNEEGLGLFRRWLAEGHRLVASAGTDIHGASDDTPMMGFNHVEVETLTEENILKAVKAGRNYLSSGPKLILRAVGEDGTIISMGETVHAPAGVRIEWSTQDQPLRLTLQTRDGEVAHIRLDPHDTGETRFDLESGGFVMAELRDAGNRLHAVTNPIFLA